MKNILIIAGPSAVGKTTLAHALLKKHEKFELVRSVTSRLPRGDAFDAEYIYLTNVQFENLLLNGGILEHTEYAGEQYGTPRSEIERIQAEGKIPLLILDLEGVHAIINSENDFNSCALYIYAPIDVLDKRLQERYGNDLAKRDARMAKNRVDYARLKEIKSDFYKFIENVGNVGKSLSEIEKSFADFCKGQWI